MLLTHNLVPALSRVPWLPRTERNRYGTTVYYFCATLYLHYIYIKIKKGILKICRYAYTIFALVLLMDSHQRPTTNFKRSFSQLAKIKVNCEC